MMFSVASLILSSLIVYPQYPAAVERDEAYAVRVRQGSAVERLTVYNHCEKSSLSGRTRGGDVNRRFCEFAFDDAPVTVDIAVREDVRCYKVFPASRRLKHSFAKGVISVTLEKPTTFGIQLNDYDKTILSIFADAPETSVPKKGDKGVMFVEGWVDAPGKDGVIQPPANVKEVYVAPGAVLNARLVLKTPGTFLHGRGMILDPMSDIFRYDQVKNTSRGLVRLSGRDYRVEDIKLVDARTFNFCSWGDNVAFRNVKVMSSMMCSDGITTGGRNTLVDGAWIYNGDNGIVISGCRDAVFRNVTIGTSCAAIFPQGNNYNVRFEDTDVFRADGGVINNFHNDALMRNTKWSEMNTGRARKEPDPQDRKHLVQQFFFERFSAVDSTMVPWFFLGRNMGAKEKTFAFHDLALPAATGAEDWRSIGKKSGAAVMVMQDPKRYLNTSNYDFAITNLAYDGKIVDALPVVKYTPDELCMSVVRDGRKLGMSIAPDRVAVNWSCPERRKVPRAKALENLLEDRKATRSIWQRMPSWLVKFEACERDEKGAVLYHLVQCEKRAGIQAVITERVKAAGYGKYRLRFEAKAKSETPFGFTICIRSNEERHGARIADISTDGEWHAYELDIDLGFDAKVNDLVSVGFLSTAPADDIWFRNFSLGKIK